ncbi:PAS domain-containing sensor histidine kinase [Kordiimonas gwangyangensis]|uniref:PAS domain-containing sensor histidine kinase n=2 Tax=Kordiimonas gwangyangensis TaxID=288022 RepID=UPI00035FB554|nr:PAS domain-containing sensor histidine kinase [Kordiimonas gwangyangensis]
MAGEAGKTGTAALLDALAEGVMVRSGDRFIFVNETVLKIVGYEGTTEQFMAEGVERWVHPDDVGFVQSYYDKRIKGHDVPESYELRLLRADGETCWVTCRASTIQWNGETCVAACVYDITEQKIKNRQFERAESIFRSIFRLTPEVMLISSLSDGKIIDVNPAFLNVFGRRRDEVIGHTTQEINIWADQTFLGRFVEELKMTASMTDVPTTVRTRGNLIRHFRIFAQKIEIEGEPMLLLIGRDVTEDLVQAQELQRSRDTAELANRAKSEFLANMSHELRTPLNAILGFAEILREEMVGPLGSPRYKEYAHDIHESGTHLLSIINDILDLSKVEAGRLEAYLTWIDPLESLEMCMTLVQQRAFEASLSLEHQFDQNVLIEADERLIKQIALNLLSNAIKFTEPGGKVAMNLEKTGTGGLCLSVTDTGIGMTAEEIKIAKRPFGQVDSSLSRRHEGSGLGLPLVTAFAEKLSATMTIDSRPGVGTRVSVVFPPFKVREKDDD